MLLLSLLLLTTEPSPLAQEAEPTVRSLVDSTLFCAAGTMLSSASLVAGAGYGLLQLSPWGATLGNEFLLTSEIAWIGAKRCFIQMFKKSPLFSLFGEKTTSTSAWDHNQQILSSLPASSEEDVALLHFLQRRWLAKSTGCYLFMINWMCPSFGIFLQAHPESTNSYARDPWNDLSRTYLKRVSEWKEQLPHPKEFPLILTRPADLREYLPCSLASPPAGDSPLIVDFTSLQEPWPSYEKEFSKWCEDHKIDLNRLICIQQVQQKDVGGIRILPFASASKEQIEQQTQFLLERIARFGLSASRIELDRCSLPTSRGSTELKAQIPCETKQSWSSFFHSFEWSSDHPQKNLMVQGTLQVLKDLCDHITEENWNEAMKSPTRSAAAQVSFAKIKEQLQMLSDKGTFYDVVTPIEQIHADLSSLLEIFSPFTRNDFPRAFSRHLTCIPSTLQPLTQYGLHSSGMTSLTGIFKAVEKSVGRPLHVLYGENAYFECIIASEHMTQAQSTKNATEQDWEDVDVILAQFNPALKRINFKVVIERIEDYHVENIADMLHKALKNRQRPLTLALDATFDYHDSRKVANLLTEFQREIVSGALNIICFRSGLKFDIFGMDNYCGAPFFMIHNQDPKWAPFDLLHTDPALQADRLSLNWFCLAFQNATPYLEAYRKQIFDNTRSLLERMPKRLLTNTTLDYRVAKMDSDAEAAFIDIKVFGPLNWIRAGLFVGMYLTVKCMESGHPLFYRPSLGFCHPNVAVLFGKNCSTVRLTLGLDPEQVDIMAKCFEVIDSLNGNRYNAL